MGMSSQDWLRFRNPIMSSAKEPVILTKFNRHPKYIAFKNCVVDFEKSELIYCRDELIKAYKVER